MDMTTDRPCFEGAIHMGRYRLLLDASCLEVLKRRRCPFIKTPMNFESRHPHGQILFQQAGVGRILPSNSLKRRRSHGTMFIKTELHGIPYRKNKDTIKDLLNLLQEHHMHKKEVGRRFPFTTSTTPQYSIGMGF